MSVIGKSELEIRVLLEAISRRNDPLEVGKNYFVVKRTESKWQVEFHYQIHSRYILKTKRGKFRKFARMSGVLAWMEKMKVNEFRVLI
jgi:hypothetical protein